MVYNNRDKVLYPFTVKSCHGLCLLVNTLQYHCLQYTIGFKTMRFYIDFTYKELLDLFEVLKDEPTFRMLFHSHLIYRSEHEFFIRYANYLHPNLSPTIAFEKYCGD